MRFLFFITIFFVFVSNANAQLPKKLKYDELIYSFDSTTVLIRKGSWNSVYNLKSNSYDIAPTKSSLINFPSSNIYAEIKPELDLLSIHVKVDGNVIQVFGTLDSCYVAIASPQEGEYFYDYNGEFFEQEIEGELLSEINYKLDWTKFEIIKCVDGNYILNHYYNGQMAGTFSYYDDTKDAMASRYYFIESMPLSGVYNLELKKWVIEPTYKRCYHINGFVIGLNEISIKGALDGDNFTHDSYKYLYDVFELKDNDVLMVETGIEKFDEVMLATLLNVDSVLVSHDDVHYTTEKNGLQGFVYFDYKNANIFSKDFYFNVILEEEYKLIIYSPFYRHVLVLNALGEIQLFHLFENNSDTIQDREMIELVSSDKEFLTYSIYDNLELDPIYCNSSGCYERDYSSEGQNTWKETDEGLRTRGQFGLCFINDSLVKINYFIDADYSGYPIAIESIDYPGQDSLDGKGNIVYYGPDVSGLDSSGIYNIRAREWLISPSYYSVNAGYNGYVLQNRYRNYENTIYGNTEYHVVDLNGKIIAENISEETFFSTPELFSYAYSGGAVDSVFEAPIGLDQHTLKNNHPNLIALNNNRPEVYYMRCGNKLGLYQMGPELSNVCTNEIFEFVHYNPDTKSYFYLEGDSIYFRSQFCTTSVSKKSGKIIFATPHMNAKSENEFEVLKIENGDTTLLGEQLDYYKSLTIVSIELKGELLIVNDHTTFVDNSCVECVDEDRNFVDYRLNYESESSSVWKKTDKGWQRISPYYATMTAIPNYQFVASSGFFEFEPYNYYSKPKPVFIAGRYMLLDSSMIVIPYLDYFDFPLIEDLGFGLKVCMDNVGCFFMTYDRVAVTDAEWDDFELYNGKLKAIKYEKPKLDERGNQVYDQDGMPINLSESVIMFFKIP